MKSSKPLTLIQAYLATVPTVRTRAVTQPLHERTTVKLPVITAPLLAVVPTAKLPAITNELTEMPTQVVPAIAPGDDDITEKRPAITKSALQRQIEEFAREDGVTPRCYIARLLNEDYKRRMIGREVKALTL